MVQFVFVHGVSTRRDPSSPTEYDSAVSDRGRRFETVTFRGKPVTIRNPYWGDFGAHPAWKLACVPDLDKKSGAVALGNVALGNVALGTVDLAQSKTLTTAAREDFGAVVSALSVEDIDGAQNDQGRLQREVYWAAAAQYVIDLDGTSPPWLTPNLTDAQFLKALDKEVQVILQSETGGSVALGLNPLEWVGKTIAGASRNVVSGPIAKVAREKLTPQIAIFIGDVFRYLKDGAGRPDIRRAVSDEIVEALKAQAAGEPLILMGHSMGGVILYDMLSDTKAVSDIEARAGKPLKVDVLITVGSQVALFEELKVFENSDEGITQPDKVKGPAPVERWWNVYDNIDVLSFLTAPAFEKAEDFHDNTVAGVKDAHGAYFSNQVFYKRLNKRLTDAGLI